MPVNAATAYNGRFAPSPTGPLHFGSLCAALAGYLDARAHRGRWLLRIEDIDPPREIAGASDAIIESLRQHGLHWDGDILWQHDRIDAYRDRLQQLLDRGEAFACRCSGSELKRRGALHRGDCHAGDQDDAAFRLAITEGTAPVFEDRLQGRYTQDLFAEVGDFVIWRRDGCVAYQLAVVVDDADSGITDIVRGTDLIESTPRQLALQSRLGLPQPRYLHLPVATHADGSKLSKQTHAPAIDNQRAPENLKQALTFLGQPLPATDNVTDILRFATARWQPQAIPRQMSIPV